MEGYYWRDGWYFRRLDNGDVEICDETNDRSLTIPPNEWASIIASVSAKGETGEQFSEAEQFHG